MRPASLLGLTMNSFLTQPERVRWLRYWLPILLALLPALYLFVLINKHGVDVPYADEFTMAPLYLKAHTGTLTAGDLWVRHNEHRNFVTKVVLVGFARWADGNLRAQMFASAFLALVTAASLWAITCRTFAPGSSRAAFVLVFSSLLIFSPVQAENWTWGFQISVFMTNCFLIAAIWAAICRWPLFTKFLICGLFAFLATFSFGNGILVWGLSFPVALLLDRHVEIKRRVLWMAAWGIIGAVTFYLFFEGLQRPSQVPNAATVSPLDIYTYITAFFGGHLARSYASGQLWPSVLVGTTLLLIYGAAATYVFRFRRDLKLFRTALPWVAIGGFGVMSALLVAGARIGFGPNQALDSRYTSFSLYLSIGIIGLLGILGEHWMASPRSSRFSRLRHWAEPALAGAFVVLWLWALAWGAVAMADSGGIRLAAKAGLLVMNVIDSRALYETQLAANAADARRFSNMFDSIGLMRPPLVKSAEVAELRIGSGAVGFVDTLRKHGPQTILEGWAFLKKRRQPADAVLLAFGERGGSPRLFAVTTELTDRPDVAFLLHDRSLSHVGWIFRFERDMLPADAEFTVFALDAKKGIFHPLGAAQPLP